MSLLSWIAVRLSPRARSLQVRRRYAELQARRAYAAGQAYARECLRQRMHPEEITRHSDLARLLGDYTPFDAGIESVLRAIPRLENHL